MLIKRRVAINAINNNAADKSNPSNLCVVKLADDDDNHNVNDNDNAA